MIISNITPPQVWSASSRSLTNFGSGALAATSTVQTTLAAATTVDLRPSAGTVSLASISVITGTSPTASMFILLKDPLNTQAYITTAIATAAIAGASGPSTNSVGWSVFNNDAAVAGKYIVAQFTLTI